MVYIVGVKYSMHVNEPPTKMMMMMTVTMMFMFCGKKHQWEITTKQDTCSDDSSRINPQNTRSSIIRAGGYSENRTKPTIQTEKITL